MVPRSARTHPIRNASLVALIACLGGSAQTAPEKAGQQRMLEAMRAYAVQYVANLPNFLCEQVTRQYQAGRKPNHWRKGDVLTFRLLYSNGEEQRNLELVNDQPLRAGMRRWRTPLQTEGEFGLLLDSVFGPESAASFAWIGWQTIRGKRAAAFDFAIDVKHSTMTLRLSDLAKATVPYHGTVYGDPENGAIWRIVSEATELPKKLETESISTTIDYDQTPIGNRTYLLPVAASIWMKADRDYIRNELEFRNYRKFEADSVIKYASADDTAGPQPPPE